MEKNENARIKTVEEPLLLLNHYFKSTTKQLTIWVLYQWATSAIAISISKCQQS